MGKKTTAHKEWRKFELAVSRLEALLRPRGYAFKSPDRLLDHDTGELREVDCSITHVSSKEVVSLECRRRGKKQDVLWVEQLVCKRDSLGLAGTIAVASKGFSRAAQAKAQRRGIVLKTYREIADPTFLVGTAHGLRLRHLVQRGTIRPGTLSYETDDDEPELDVRGQASVSAALEAASEDAVILRDGIGGDLTLPTLIKACLARLTDLSVGAFSRKCRMEFPPKTVALAPVDVPVFVRALTFVLDVEVTESPLRQPTLFRYEGGTEVPLQVASAEAQTAERGPMRLQIVFTTEDSLP
jgi:hypothetical protein